MISVGSNRSAPPQKYIRGCYSNADLLVTTVVDSYLCVRMNSHLHNITSGVLPFAQWAKHSLFKIVPDDFVPPQH